MRALIVIIPISIVFGLVAWAAEKASDRYIDLMVMLEDRHTSRTVDKIVREQIEAADEFHKGLIQGMEDVND